MPLKKTKKKKKKKVACPWHEHAQNDLMELTWGSFKVKFLAGIHHVRIANDVWLVSLNSQILCLKENIEQPAYNKSLVQILTNAF